MKKLFLFLLPVLIFSCTEKELFITLSDTSVTMFYDGTKQLSVSYSSDELKSKTYNYTSSDSTIVSVSKTGLVSGVSIGSATVKVTSSDGKYSAECIFTVSAKSTLYKEPYTVFGSSISTVKSKETRVLFKETTTSLIYSDSDVDVRNVLYLFENGKFTSACVLLTETTSVATEVTTFLMERYMYLGVSNSVFFFKERKTGNILGLTVDDTLGLCVLYIPPTSASSVQIQKLTKSINIPAINKSSMDPCSNELKKIIPNIPYFNHAK